MAKRSNQQGMRYRLGREERIEDVARRFCLPVEEIVQFNGGQYDVVSTQHEIFLPIRQGCPCGRFYTLHRHESLKQAADRNGMTLAQLLSCNPYLNPKEYVEGQTILLSCGFLQK